MNVRAGDISRPCCARLHARHEAEQTALRLRIVVLESALERKSEALHRLMVFFEESEQTSDRPLADDLDDLTLGEHPAQA